MAASMTAMNDQPLPEDQNSEPSYAPAVRDVLECVRDRERPMSEGYRLAPILLSTAPDHTSQQRNRLIAEVKRILEHELTALRLTNFGATRVGELKKLPILERITHDYQRNVTRLQFLSIASAFYIERITKPDIADACGVVVKTIENRLRDAHKDFAQVISLRTPEENSASSERSQEKEANVPSTSSGYKRVPYMTDELQNLFVIVTMLLVIITAMVWPGWTIGVLLGLISWRTFSNAWLAFRLWRMRSSADDQRLAIAYVGLWLWVLCLGIYTAAGATNVSINTPLWPRIAYMLQCLVVGGGLIVLGNADILFGLYRRLKLRKPSGILRLSEERAHRVWDRRWTIVYSFAFLLFLFSISMVSINLIGLIDIRVLF